MFWDPGVQGWESGSHPRALWKLEFSGNKNSLSCLFSGSQSRDWLRDGEASEEGGTIALHRQK